MDYVDKSEFNLFTKSNDKNEKIPTEKPATQKRIQIDIPKLEINKINEYKVK